MRMTASWFGSLDLPHTRLWCDSIAPKSRLPSDCHPAARSNQDTDDGKNASPCLTQKAPYKGLSADSEEKQRAVTDIDWLITAWLKVRVLSAPTTQSCANRRRTLPSLSSSRQMMMAWKVSGHS